MKKLFILLLISKSLFAYFCPVGCLDSSTQNIYTKQGQVNYDINDNSMLKEFKDLSDKMTQYYQDFENKSSNMIEDGAKVQYLENVLSSEAVFELQKSNDLKNIEVESSAVKVNQNSQSTAK